MEKSALLKRINDKLTQIDKLVNKYDKYSRTVSEQFLSLCNQYLRTGDNTTLRQLVAHQWDGPEYNLYHTAISLYEARLTNQKYLNQLKAIESRESITKIDVIWNFLLDYKNLVNNWLRDNASVKDEYYRLDSEYCDMHNSRQYTSQQLREFYNRVCEVRNSIHPLTDKYYRPSRGWDETGLNRELDKLIENKYWKLINQVTEICGEIIDASNLHIHAGELNGIINGTNGSAKINTIGAGGYNIQCFHYRTLIKAVK